MTHYESCTKITPHVNDVTPPPPTHIDNVEQSQAEKWNGQEKCTLLTGKKVESKQKKKKSATYKTCALKLSNHNNKKETKRDRTAANCWKPCLLVHREGFLSIMGFVTQISFYIIQFVKSLVVYLFLVLCFFFLFVFLTISSCRKWVNAFIDVCWQQNMS